MKDERLVTSDASASIAGFRLQKIRAAKLALEYACDEGDGYSLVAVEYLEDVNQKVVASSGSKDYFEQDKRHTIGKNFSATSEDVIHALACFLESWILQEYKSNVKFGFYTTNGNAKERLTEKLTELKIQLPTYSISEKLSNGELNDEISEILGKVLLNYLEKKYAEHQGNSVIIQVKKFTNTDWSCFLKKVSFSFNAQNLEQLEKEVFSLIKTCPYFSSQLSGKEEYIKSEIFEMLEKKCINPNPEARWVHSAEIQVIFEKMKLERELPEDPAHESMGEFETKDKRGLEEKVRAVADNFTTEYEKYCLSLSRKMGISLVEQNKFKTNKSVVSLRYRIFMICFDILEDFKEKVGQNKLSRTEMHNIVEELADKAKIQVDDLAKNYNYPFTSRDSIRNMIVELIGSCFLAFDEGAND